MTLIEELQRQLEEARADIARYKNSHYILAIENSHLKTQLHQRHNTHPAAIQCQCAQCAVYSV